jgi:hypothetical protein
VIRSCGWLWPQFAAPRAQPEVAAYIATLLESVFIFDSEYEGQSDQRPNSAHLLQECGLRIIFPGDLLDFVLAANPPHTPANHASPHGRFVIAIGYRSFRLPQTIPTIL